MRLGMWVIGARFSGSIRNKSVFFILCCYLAILDFLKVENRFLC